MIKTLTSLLKQDKEKFVVPKGVQDVIPVKAIYDDGIFKVGKDKYSKTYKFTDINYAVASREDKEAMFLEYSELLNSLDSGATTKLTINNRRLNRLDFEKAFLIDETGDPLDKYRREYNKILLDKATGANAIVQDKYVTISINKKSVEDARTYFARVGADLIAHFSRLAASAWNLKRTKGCVSFTTSSVSGRKRPSALTSKRPERKDTISKTISAPTQWSLKRTISRWETVLGESFFFVNMRPISKTVWWRSLPI